MQTLIILAIHDLQLRHVSTRVGHLQVIVKHNEVVVVYFTYMTAVVDVVFVVDCVACSMSVFLGLCLFLSLCDCCIKNRNFGDGVVVEFCLCGILVRACV
jgi:hypothetical protein